MTTESNTCRATRLDRPHDPNLAGLVDKSISNAPDAYVIVAQIIPLGYGTNDVIKTYNQSIPGVVQQRANEATHITTVDMFTGFAPATMLGSDNSHPSSAGYKLMADLNQEKGELHKLLSPWRAQPGVSWRTVF